MSGMIRKNSLHYGKKISRGISKALGKPQLFIFSCWSYGEAETPGKRMLEFYIEVLKGRRPVNA